MDETRGPNQVTVTPESRELTGESLRQQIDALQAKYALEQEAAAKAEAEKSPPRPFEQVAIEMLSAISNHLGNPHGIDALRRELARMGKP
jgi:ribosomal protein L29